MRAIWLFTTLAVATIVACGAAPAPVTPASPAASSSSSAAPASAPAPSGTAGAGGVATLGDESFAGPMKPIVPSAMLADLTALGLDPAALPALDQLPPAQLRKVMKTFTKALGVHCNDCHIEGDFDAPTQRKAIATGMWNHFVREMSAKDGTPVYCDSCHQGTMTPLLDRHDDKALGHWMDQNYVLGLKRRDGKEHKCKTCHGDPFQGHFLKSWLSVPGNAPAAK